MNSVTVNSLMDAMKDELTKLFKEFRFKNEAGDDVGFTIFKHDLPIPEGEDDPQPFPYIVVRAPDGGSTSPESEETARIILVFGIYDDTADNQGNQDVLIAIERVRERFEKNPLLNGKYRKLCSDKYPFRWTIDEEAPFPYFFGGVEMTFAIPHYELEDKYS